MEDLLGADETEDYAESSEEPEAYRFVQKKQEIRPVTASTTRNEIFKIVDQQYPISSYKTFSNMTMFHDLAQSLSSAMKAEPNLYTEVIERLSKMMESQEIGTFQNPPQEIGYTLDTIFETASIASQKGDTNSLFKLRFIIDKIYKYNLQGNQFIRPKWFRTLTISSPSYCSVVLDDLNKIIDGFIEK